MANFTKHGDQTSTQEYLCTTGLGIHQKRFLLTLNIPISIMTVLGNALIIAALTKVSSLHPPSKLLLGCLASTDLSVGLVTRPLRISLFMSPEHSRHCYYIKILYESIGGMICGVSVLTVTATSVDRLLALMLGLRYRQIVTFERVWVIVVISWLFTTAVAVARFYSYRNTAGIICMTLLFCIVTSIFCYTKIFLRLRHHQTQVQDQVNQRQPDEGAISQNIARYRKTVSNALWIQVTLLACCLPYGIATATVVITGLDTPDIGLVWSVTVSLLLLNSLLNPFLYCWKIREVRQAVKDTIRQVNGVIHLTSLGPDVEVT